MQPPLACEESADFIFFYSPRAGDTPLFSRGARPLDFSLHPKNKPAPATQAIGRPLPQNEIGEWGIIFWWNGAVDTATFLTSVKG